ncbi:hypothetical protein [Effusibacillus lacus]|uniref:Uncharacterized protein n=1 Tax=Effusibacillus lacus TaxID=1348429 RepID=A0A292YMV2_9BACL|nr:hypothetical protein [Effusibacillus lacus]TCS72286.1 hypothetical protein EDD64_12239 [Effusibacillus lacus]GAX90241.1 hypothetical protein EFBL_1867 [Effusibacillus lacus]
MTILFLARQVNAWNLRIIGTLPPVPSFIKERDPGTFRYLQGRKRVFSDFAAAAQKIEFAFLRSGPLLYFQLDVDLRTIFARTLHEVRELKEFIPELIRRFPGLEVYYSPLAGVLEEIEQEMLVLAPCLIDGYIPVPTR